MHGSVKIGSQFPYFCNMQKIPGSIGGLLFCTHPDGFRETLVFLYFVRIAVSPK